MCKLAMAMTAIAAMAASAAEKPLVGPAPDWVQPAAAEPPTATTTDAALLILLNDQQVRLTPDAVEQYSDTRIRIQTPQGLQAMGTIALSWQPDNDVITVHRLTVRRDANVRNLLGNGGDFTVLRREDMLEQATLTGALTAILQPSDLQVGDIVEFAYTKRHADPVVPDRPSLQYAWLNTPIQTVRFRAEWPKKMAVRWQVQDFKPAVQETSSGSNQSIAFTLENPPPLLQPTGAPARFTALRRLQLTAFQSWAEVSRRLAPLYADASKLAGNSPLRGELERIRAAGSEPKARAAAALKLVQENVRYVLLAMNDGALVPANADETWQRRYGDCKAKTALLLALLRELGIEAEPVAVNTVIGEGTDRMLPGISAFDHVLVRAQIGGKAYWLDGTRPGDRNLDQLQIPAFGWGLPLTARGSELIRIQPEVLKEPQYVQEISIDATSGVDDPVPFKGNIVFRGDTAMSLKLSQDNLAATQRDQGLRNFWRSRFDDLQLASVGSSFDEATGALTWTATGTLKMEWSEGGYFELDDMQLGYKADFSRAEGADTEAPYAIAFPDYALYRATVKLPSGARFTVSGEDINQTLAGREYRRNAHIVNGEFTAEASSRSLVAEISAKEAHAAEAGLREMYKNRLFILKSRQLLSAADLQSQAGKPLATANEYIQRGLDMVDRAMFEPALAEFSAAIKLEPDNTFGWSNRGNAYFNLKRFREARSDLLRALELDPDDAYSLGVLGAVALREGKPAEAIDLLTKSLALRDDDEWSLGERADAYLAAGDASRAAQDLVAISRLNASSFIHFATRANQLVNQHRMNDVRILARIALDEHAGPGEGALIASQIYTVAGDDAAARDTLNEGILRAPAAELYMALSEKETSPEKMLAALQKAVELNPQFVPALKKLIAIQMAMMKFDEAHGTANRLEAVAGQAFDARVTRAVLFAESGASEQARESFASGRSIATKEDQFLQLCWAEVGAGLLPDALLDCDSALATSPNCLACLEFKGIVFLRMGRNEEAESVFNKALALNPQDPYSLYGRGIAEQRLAREEEGRTDIATALSIDRSVESRFEGFGLKR
jgi:tetratricopeptide (TPR) repeat protein